MNFSLSNLEQDIPRDLAVGAYSAISFYPEKRGESDIQEYASDLRGDYAELEALCKTDTHREILDSLFPIYRETYARLYRGYLVCKGRTMSPMITGPARFPVNRNQKALASEHNRLTELIEFRQRTVARIRKRILFKSPEEQNAADIAKLEKLRKLQQVMKETNTIIRSGRDVRERLLAIPFKPETVDAILKPDYAGRIGFPPYEFTSIRGKIERLEKAIAKGAQPLPAAETLEGNGCRLVKNPTLDRVQLLFPGKPDPETIERLKRAAFRWSPTNKAWQRQLTPNGIAAAIRFLSA